ncbi:MAG TPA: GtrA family protein [Longimicrobiaceae bacterium]|nr:GtrA family protein [Longimicrobiaceae bacterium]
MRKFIRFAALSGCGWLLDFCLLLVLVHAAAAPPLLANLVSSTTAASAVFLVSRACVFDSSAGGVHARLGVYVLYTLVVILAASALVGVLASRLASPGVFGLLAGDATEAAAIAKVIVTPPQLLLNFVVSKFLNERAALRARSIGA